MVQHVACVCAYILLRRQPPLTTGSADIVILQLLLSTFYVEVYISWSRRGFHFKLRDGSRKTVSVPSGTTVLEAAHQHQADIIATT